MLAVARYGVAVPTRRRQGDTWHPDVCRIEVVAFGLQAAMVGAALRKGRGVLIEGRLQWRRWEQDGQYCRTREVIAEGIVNLMRKMVHLCSKEDYRWLCTFLNPCIFAAHTPSHFLQGKVSGRDFQ
jgi:hypothetical protein